MKRNERTAFNQMKAIGAPVFERDGELCVSAEDNDETIWADYYMEYGINRDSDTPGVLQDLCDIAHKNKMFLEWENAGCLVACEA